MISAEDAKKLQKSYNIVPSTLKEINFLVIDTLKTTRTSITISLPGVSMFHIDEIINELEKLEYRVNKHNVHGHNAAYRYTLLTISW